MITTISEKRQIWDRVLIGIQNEIMDPRIFDSFFNNSYIYSISGDTIVVSVNSKLAANLISTKYNDLISEVVAQTTQSKFKLVFMPESEIQASATPVTEKVEEKKQFFVNSFINPKHTFDSFVVGQCNREASQASLMIASNPGKLFNPLFIYSQSGLGKTHLLHAIGNYIKENTPRLKVLYISTDDFVDEFVRSVRGDREIEELRDFFKTVDVLLIDDIQFLADKNKTADMFFNVFNTMINLGKQVVLTSDRHPNDLKGLEARLVTRFNAGLSINIQEPDKETLLSILKMKIEANNLDITNFDDDVLDFIAEKFSKNIRELEGAINRLLFYSINIKQSKHIDLPLAIESVSSIINVKETERMLSEERIIEVVADYYNLTVSQLKGNVRTSQLALARHISMYLIRTMLDVPFKKIGQTFGGKDHSTVMSAVEKVESNLKTNPQLSQAIHEIQNRLKNS
ncbi:chromosomal replication initiator protein DnaA [Coprobacillus sp. CAG:826]|nr:chromosomal replication initiator protein DnaA [Coprobacillus sp.]CDD92411.1 chromosomal replication initiator protein DnaA [Coprobacillus sp. CAG:826]